MIDGEDKIIKRAVGGETSAFGELYDHYQPKIYRFVLIKVSHREEAEDLTHKVFLSAWQNIGSYKELGFPFSSWLYRIARNQIIDHYRTRKASVSIDEVDPEQFAEFEDTAVLLERKIDHEKVLEGIRKLRPEYQDVVIMRFVEELTPKEVAEVLGKSEGAIKLIQHRAVRQLKEILDTNDPR